MPLFTTYANDTLDQQLPNAGSGTATVGGTTYALPFRAQLTSTLCTDTAVGTAIGSPITIAGAFATAAASKSKTSTAALSLTGAPAGTWADVAIIDSSGTPKPVAYKGSPSLAKTVNAGDTLIIPAGQLTGTATP